MKTRTTPGANNEFLNCREKITPNGRDKEIEKV